MTSKFFLNVCKGDKKRKDKMPLVPQKIEERYLCITSTGMSPLSGLEAKQCV